MEGSNGGRAEFAKSGLVRKAVQKPFTPSECDSSACTTCQPTRGDRFISQLLNYCPGNTPKVSNRSRNSPLSGLMTITFGVFVSKIQ